MSPDPRAGTRIGLHLWTAWALVAAPLLNALSRHREFLVAHDLDLPRLLALLVVVLVLVPLPSIAVARLAGERALWPRWLLLPPLLLLGLAATVSAGLGRAALPAGVAFAVLGLAGYWRSAALRRYATWLAPIALVAPAMLLGGSLLHRISTPSALAAAGATGIGAPTVVIILDELPVTSLLDDAGELDSRRFPHLAALAAGAHWFDNVRSVDTSTPKAVSALLTGSELVKGQLPTAGDLPVNLFTLLAPTHHIAALEPVTRLCPPSLNELEGASSSRRAWILDTAVVALHLVTPPPFASRLPAIDAQWAGFGEPAVNEDDSAPAARPTWRHFFTEARQSTQLDRVAQFDAFLAAIDDRRQGALYVAHLLLPHRPWIYLPSGASYWRKGFREPPAFQDKAWPASPAYAEQVYQRHLLQSEFVDVLVGRLVARLRDQGVYDRALLAITADHGISFLPGEMKRGITPANRLDVLQVPLLLKLPGQTEGVHHREARSTLDLLPTLLAALGLETPAGVEGRSLLSPAAPAPARAPWWPMLERRGAVFGSLGRPGALFALGPTPQWLGRPLAGLDLPSNPDLHLELVAPGRDLSRRAGASSVPAWVYGRLTGPAAARPLGLALAVDGVVRATAGYDPQAEKGFFRALLPESALNAGDHALTVIVVDPESGRASLPAG